MSGYADPALEKKRLEAERWIRQRPLACRNRALSVMALRARPVVLPFRRQAS